MPKNSQNNMLSGIHNERRSDVNNYASDRCGRGDGQSEIFFRLENVNILSSLSDVDGSGVNGSGNSAVNNFAINFLGEKKIVK